MGKKNEIVGDIRRIKTAATATFSLSAIALFAVLLTPELAMAQAACNDGSARVANEQPQGCGGYGGGVPNTGTESTGGQSNPTNLGTPGANGNAGNMAGGGGGAGTTGGNGGNAFGAGGVGGLGGAVPSANGDPGGNGSSGLGGGGGGGGAHGRMVDANATNNSTSTIQGGNGGNGGNGASSGGGGGGGAGGYGVVIETNPVIFDNAGTIKGGSGGEGGNSVNGSVGEGGTGGNGLFVSSDGNTVTNSGTIEGGRGGDSGHSSSKITAFAESGSGGNGIVFLESSSGNTLVNSGTVLGGRAGNADPDTWNLAGIGGDGVWGSDVGISIINTGLIQGGTGGDGGARGPDDAYTYLKGGYGGDGVYIKDAQSDSSIINKGRIIGGEGGTGTAGDKANPVLRGGGPGGWGIYAENMTIINDAGAEITGGKGGTSLDLSKGAHGNGGEGIYGSDLHVYTSGTISGGFDGSGTVQANAITFTKGANYLELGPGFIMNGNVVVESESSTLALGGSGSATFDVSNIGILGANVQYQGFSTFLKTGNSVWALTGSPVQPTPWTIEQGVLQISANSNLGVDTNPLTFDSSGAIGAAQPTLRFGAPDITLSRNVVLATTDGSFDTFGNTATITGDITGSGSLIKTGAGSLILSGNNAYSGDTLVKAGALVAGKANVFIPSSIHTIESGAELDLAGFNQTIDEVKNAGTIITNGTAPNPDTTLTVANSYVGAGGTLELSTFLGTDDSPSDRLVIDGGTASGNSFLRIKNVDGLGALTTGDGILVVEAINGGITASNAFALSGRAVAGPYEYSLYRSGFVANPTNENSWYLRSHLLDAPEIPHYREETSNYTALPPMTLLYGQNLIGTLHERVGEEEDIRGRSDLHEKTPDTGAWGRVFGVYGKHDGDKRGIYGKDGPKYDYDFVGLQVGHDLYRSERPDGSRNHLGAYFAYGHADGTATHFDGVRGSNKFNAYTLGGYWTHFGESGWYTDTVLQGTYYDATSTSLSHDIPRLDVDGFGLAVSVEGGKPFRFDKGWFIEPQAQLIYQYVDINDAKDIGAQITFNNVDSLAGRIGARLGRTWMRDTGRQMTMWVRPNIWHEFRGKTVTKFSSADGPMPFQSNLNGTWGEINVGVSGQLDRKTTLFANVSYNERFDGKGHGYNGKIGVRVNW